MNMTAKPLRYDEAGKARLMAAASAIMPPAPVVHLTVLPLTDQQRAERSSPTMIVWSEDR